MEKEKLIEIIKEKSEDGGLQCAQALALAKELKVPPKQIGELLNELDIKIRKCQLGCF